MNRDRMQKLQSNAHPTWSKNAPNSELLAELKFRLNKKSNVKLIAVSEVYTAQMRSEYKLQVVYFLCSLAAYDRFAALLNWPTDILADQFLGRYAMHG